ISRALNLSDRLSSCTKITKRLFKDNASPFNVFVLQPLMEDAAEDEGGESLEPVVVRKGFVHQLLPGAKVGAQGPRPYYEVCTDAKLLDLARKKFASSPPRHYNSVTEAPGARWSSWPSKPLILSFAGRMVGSTPTRFRHIYLVRRELQKNRAAESGIKSKQTRLRARFSAARVTVGFVCSWQLIARHCQTDGSPVQTLLSQRTGWCCIDLLSR